MLDGRKLVCPNGELWVQLSRENKMKIFGNICMDYYDFKKKNEVEKFAMKNVSA